MRVAFWPLIGGLILTGCKYDIVDCTRDEEAYIEASRDWVTVNADTIDANMQTHWTKPRAASMEQVLVALGAARLQCGVGNRESDGVAASQINPGNRIVIDVSSTYFATGFEQFVAHRWVTEYSLAELDDPTTATIDRNEHPAPINESLEYESALGVMGLLLTHEPGHMVLGDHSPAAKDRADAIAERVGEAELDPEDLRQVDEIYALGFWTLQTAQLTWRSALDEYIATLQDE